MMAFEQHRHFGDIARSHLGHQIVVGCVHRLRKWILLNLQKVTMVRVLLIALWAVASLAGYIYALQQHIPVPEAMRVLPAFLMEAGFFYVLGSDRLRARVERWPPAVTAFALIVAAVLPYSEAELALGSFRLS